MRHAYSVASRCCVGEDVGRVGVVVADHEDIPAVMEHVTLRRGDEEQPRVALRGDELESLVAVGGDAGESRAVLLRHRWDEPGRDDSVFVLLRPWK